MTGTRYALRTPSRAHARTHARPTGLPHMLRALLARRLRDAAAVRLRDRALPLDDRVARGVRGGVPLAERVRDAPRELDVARDGDAARVRDTMGDGVTRRGQSSDASASRAASSASLQPPSGAGGATGADTLRHQYRS